MRHWSTAFDHAHTHARARTHAAGASAASSRVADRLDRGDLVRVLYRLARSHATGVLTVFPARGQPELLVLRRGYLMATDAGAEPTGGRRTAQRLERLAAQDGARCHFEGGLSVYPPGAPLRQYSVAAWARRHLEAQLDARAAQGMLHELGGVRLGLRPELVPEPAWCDETDRRILAAMAVPRRLDQIWPLARTARFRLLSFIYFLRAVGAVTFTGVAARPVEPPADEANAYRLLGVPSNADIDTVKRAYRRLARALHPDLHAELDTARRRQLERKLADVNSAYRRLVGVVPA